MRVDAVIFDMDGLMLDTEQVYLRSWQRAMADFGFEAPKALYVQTIGLTDAATTALYRSVLDPGCPVEAVRAREQQYFEAHLAAHGPPIKAGLFDLLDQLDDLRLRKAVASSTVRATVEANLFAAGVLGRFDAIVGGDEVANGKPAPDIFLTAARRVDVTPGCCLVLEDSEPGVRAAHAAGMIPILVPDLKAPSPAVVALAYRVVDSLNDVRTFLAERSAVQ